MAKKLKFFFLFLISVLCIFGTAYFYTEKYSKPKTLHVFLEAYATGPALSQMLWYVQLPEDSHKIIAWHRFPKRSKIIDLKKYNTEEVPLKKNEGYWEDAAFRVLKKVLKKMYENPSMDFELHFNMGKMSTTIRHFLRMIPSKKIKRLHLYEDGYGDILKSKLLTQNELQGYTKQQVLDGIADEEKWEWWMSLDLHKIYPTTYHFFNGQEIKKHPFFSKLNIENINFWDLQHTLTKPQKNLLYQLTGFDYTYYKKLLKNKKFILFLMGRDPTSKIVNIFKKIKTDKNFLNINYKDYLWLFKPHPSFWTSFEEMEEVRKEFPDFLEIQAQIPAELFILSGLSPTFICGYSSSAFLSFSKKDILFVISVDNNKFYDDYYRDYIQIPDNKILELDDF